MALWAVLAMALALSARPAAAAPFAYIANGTASTVSVIDTASNTVVATVPVGVGPWGVAVTPDGKHVYVTNFASNNVSVMDTVSNTVVATGPVVNNPIGVAVTRMGNTYTSRMNPSIHTSSR